MAASSIIRARASLLNEDCTALLISDASGQTALQKEPTGDRIGRVLCAPTTS